MILLLELTVGWASAAYTALCISSAGRLRSKFVSEVLLCFSEIELVNQEEFVSVALLELADQKRV